MHIKNANPASAAAARFSAGWSRSGLRQAGCVTAGLLGMALAVSAVQVTYQVNLGTQIVLGNFHPGVDTVFVSGTFSSPQWEDTVSEGANSYLLTPVMGNTNLYTGTFSIANSAGSTEYHKFVINPGGNFSALNWESPVSTLGNNRTFTVPGVATNLPAVYFNDQILPVAAPFVAGADFSDLSFFEARNITYKEGGTNQDGIQILKDHGINCVRLRLWTGTDAMVATNNPYDYTNNLTYTVPLAVRVKNAGLQFMLDFHYSDTWADPGGQATPNAWASLNFTQLVQQMRAYNSNTIATFAAAGAMPDYVQIGNEITDGILWTNGQLTGTWSSSDPSWIRLGQLMNAAIQGIQDATNATGAKMPKIIVHIDRGGDWTTTESFFDNLNFQGVPFDIIGESYYPFFHGPLSNAANCLTNAAKRYAKPIIIAETAFPWTNSYWTTNIYGIPGTTNGQVRFLAALAQVVKTVPGRLGAGIFWWGAEYQQANRVNEAGFNTASFFDAGGNVLPVANAFGEMVAPVTLAPGLAGATLTLQWPLSGAGMSLMTATNLMSPAAWLLVPNSVQNTGIWFNVTLPVDSSQSRFYRLQSN
ncbi:MAG: glycosyl hydrolase 53 family protein [Limisphaerales bacterium]